MSVTITNKVPGGSSIQLGWNSNPAANTDANAYIATDPADFNTPNCISVPADQSGLLPGVTDFTATPTGLTPGTAYYVMCEADGLDSATDTFTTTGTPPGPTPIAHLIPKGDNDNDGPDWDTHIGGLVLIKVRTVSISNSAVRLSGITVNFAITGGNGTGKLKKASAKSNMNGVARVAFVAGQKDVLINASSPAADNSADLTVHIH